MNIYFDEISKRKNVVKQLISLCEEKGLDFKNTKFGFYADLFGTVTFYNLITEQNHSVEKQLSVYADTECTFSNRYSQKDDISEFIVSNCDQLFDFWEKLDKWNITFYSDGKTFWIPSDDTKDFESFLLLNGISSYREVA